MQQPVAGQPAPFFFQQGGKVGLFRAQAAAQGPGFDAETFGDGFQLRYAVHQPLLDFQAYLLQQVVARPVLGHRPLHARAGNPVHLRVGVAQRQIQHGLIDDQGVAGLGERHRTAEQALVLAAVAVGRVPEVHRHGVQPGAQYPAAEHHRAGVKSVHPVW